MRKLIKPSRFKQRGAISFLVNPYHPFQSPASFSADSADFDGTNDYMSRGANLSGISDSKTGIFSAWIRFDADDTNRHTIFFGVHASDFVQVIREDSGSANRLTLQIFNSSIPADIVIATSNGSYVAAATWYHLLMSWDASTGAFAMYVNDVNDENFSVLDNNNARYSGYTNWRVGANSGGTEKMNGCLAEVYFAPGQYLDFDTESNRRKFIGADGKPVSLGTDGSLPTGTAPRVYHHIDNGEAVANFATNRGSGGNFSITGTLTTGSTSPTD
jgi:hypothetical protein